MINAHCLEHQPAAEKPTAVLRHLCRWVLAVSLVLPLLLTGCVSVPPMPADTPASHNPAVLSLLDRAQKDLMSGRYVSAEANLERALRIEPGNAHLWHELALAAQLQDKFDQAESFALRANSYSRDNRQRTAIWQLIAESRAARGDHQGADEALQRADQYHNR